MNNRRHIHQHATSGESSDSDNNMPRKHANRCDTQDMTPEYILSYVLNEHNKPIDRKYIEKILKQYDIAHKVVNMNNFQIAMIHTSYLDRDLTTDRIVKLIREKNLERIPQNLIKTAMPLQKVSYERLECLGDSVIHMAVLEYLYERYPEQQEGFLTRLRTKIENKETLASLSRTIKLNQYAVMARNLEIIGGREDNDNILEDIFEAFVGALYLESDYYLCKQFVTNIIENEIDLMTLISVETNYKDMLLQYYHKQKWPDPEYGTLSQGETNNKKTFGMCVRGFVKGSRDTWDIVGKGIGASKQKGQQDAAYRALIYYGVIQIPDTTKKQNDIINNNDNDIIELSDDDVASE